MKRDRPVIPFLLAAAAIAGGALGCAGPPQTAHAKDTTLQDRITNTATFKVEVHKDIPYVTGPDVSSRQRLDVYRPVGRTNAPVLMYIHGGGWQVGSKFFIRHIGNAFAKHGIVTACVNYRLSPSVKHPAHIRDVARAFDWVRKNVRRYGGNPDDVFVGGHSAGGHLAALLALNERYLAEVGRSSDEIVGVIAISGLYRVGATSLVFRGFEPDARALVDASPEFHVDENQPPFLVIYAQNDLPLLDIQAIALAMQLERHGTPVRLLRAENRGHATLVMGIGEKDDPTTGAILDFVREYSCSDARRPKSRWGELGPPVFP